MIHGVHVGRNVKSITQHFCVNISDLERAIPPGEKLSGPLFSIFFVLVSVVCSGQHDHIADLVFWVWSTGHASMMSLSDFCLEQVVLCAGNVIGKLPQ